jgi:hypothetical protein
MIPQAPRRHFNRRGALLFALGLAALPAWAGPRQELPALFGGQPLPSNEPVPLDPTLPTGPAYAPTTRPNSVLPACSSRRRVCVHPGAAVPPPTTLATLDALELAYEELVDVLGLPPPRADHELGGTPDLDAYLDAQLEQEVTVAYDEPGLSGFDHASAWCTLAPREGPLLARAATLCVAEAIALGLDPAETPHVRRAFATALWWIVGSPTVLDLEVLAAVQLQPERALLRRDRDSASEGAALWFDYLERTRGDAPGTLSAALLSAGGQRTDQSSALWNNEPDVMDVVRHTLGERSSSTIGAYRDFAVTRAFLGWGGAFAAPRLDWTLPFSSLPRRVLLGKPVEPSGTVLVRLDVDQAAAGATLGFRAEWESPVAFAWTLVRLGADGSELSRVDLPFQERASQAEGRVTELAGVSAVLAVGTFLDEVTLAHPFDHDVEPFEPHGATVYFAKL